MENLVVTTTYKPSDSLLSLANQFAERLNCPITPRKHYSLERIRQEYNVDHVLVIMEKGPVLHVNGCSEFFFHLSMAELRIKNIINGKHDHMVNAMGLTAGMSVLDCTLGLATDAIVASFVTEWKGKVTGLEISPVVSLITGYGLLNFNNKCPEITESLRRINVINADYNSYLQKMPDKSVDVVYFDPMFRRPVKESSNMKPLRYLADPRPLDSHSLAEACRVATYRVIVKEANGSPEFQRLGITRVTGGKYSGVNYGIIELGE